MTVMLSAYLAGGQAGLPLSAAVLGASLAALAFPDAARSIAPIGISVVGLVEPARHRPLLRRAADRPRRPALRRPPARLAPRAAAAAPPAAVGPRPLAGAPRRAGRLGRTRRRRPAVHRQDRADRLGGGRALDRRLHELRAVSPRRKPLTSAAEWPMLNIDQTFFGRSAMSWAYRCARPAGDWISSGPDRDDRGERAGGPGGRSAAGRGQAGPGGGGVLRGEGPPGAGGALPRVPRRREARAGCGSTRGRRCSRGATRGPAVVPGKPEESPLIEAIRYDGDVQMPPKGKLKDAEIAALTEWVKRGAHWPAPARARPDPPRPRPTAARPPPRSRPRHGAGPVVLVVPAGRRPRAARGQRRGLAEVADRPVHPRPARGDGPGAVAAGRQGRP